MAILTHQYVKTLLMAFAVIGSLTANVFANEDCDRPYIISPGDTLSGIATRLYGNASIASIIYSRNRDVIGSNPDILSVGTEIFLPCVLRLEGMNSDAQETKRAPQIRERLKNLAC